MTVAHSIEKAVDSIGDIAKMVLDPLDAFEDQLEACVMKTLKWVTPKAADKVRGSITSTVPMLEGSSATKMAHKTVTQMIMDQKDKILDLCQDVLEFIQDGMSPVKAVKQGFRRVGVVVLRAIKSAMTAGAIAVMGCLGCCCITGGAVTAALATIFTKLVKMLKKHLKKMLYACAPDFLVDQLPWNWTHDTEIGDDTPEVDKKKAQGIPTKKQKDGKPEHNPKADHAARKMNKVAMEEEDDEPDSEDEHLWGDSDDEDDDDNYSDFDAEEGAKSDDEENPDAGAPPAEEQAPPEEEAAEAAAEEPPPEEQEAPQEEEAPEPEEPPEEAPPPEK